MSGRVELGCGLISIGRQWGTTPTVPSEADALRFLEAAYELGVRVFDTAPSYGYSEERLGLFLNGLTPSERRGVTVATKFGEHWDFDSNTGYADHSLGALKRSLDQSMHRLGSIAILQLHKTMPAHFQDETIGQAFAYAKQAGVNVLGVSVSDLVSAELAVQDDRFDAIQLPYNRESLQFQPIVKAAVDAGKFLLTNRPFQMGQVTASPTANKQQIAADAFGFILQEGFNGVVLTGTSNITHLQENIAAFQLAREGAAGGRGE